MEKFKRVNTHHFLTERMTEMESRMERYRKSERSNRWAVAAWSSLLSFNIAMWIWMSYKDCPSSTFFLIAIVWAASTLIYYLLKDVEYDM